MVNHIPSLQYIIKAQISPTILENINKSFVMPDPPSVKERINIRVLGILDVKKILLGKSYVKKLIEEKQKPLAIII